MRLVIIAFVAAIGWLQCQSVLPAIWPWLAAAGLAASIGWRSLALRPLALLVLGASLGVAYASWRAEGRLAERLPAALEQQPVTITGRVTGLPQATRFGPRFRFLVESAPAGIPPLILLADYQRPPADWQAGQRWRLDVRLKRPHGSANPGGSDYEGWLLAEGVGATGSVARGHRSLLRAFVTTPGSLVDAARARLAAHIRQALGAAPDSPDPAAHPYAEVIVALVIGEQSGISQAQWQAFRNTGITHLVSISGLHITMVAGLLGGLGGWLWRRSHALTSRLPARKAALLAGVMAAFAYTVLAGFQVPSQRTFFMLATAALALLSGRALAVSTIWLTALGVTVLLDPWAVLSPGFWLSYLTVGAMLWALAPRLDDGKGWRDKLAAWRGSQWAATLGSAPLLLILFQQLPLASPLANAIAIPVVSGAVTPLALVGALDPTGLLLRLAEWGMQGCMWLLGPLAGPSLLWSQPAPPAWTLLPAIAAVAVWLLPRGVAGKPAAVACLLPIVLPVLPLIAPGSFHAVVWDVGQGLSVLVQTAQHRLLFDAGPEGGGGRLLPGALRAAGVSRLDTLVLSHNDGDHIDGAHAVLGAVVVGQIAGVAPRPARPGETPFPVPPTSPCLAGQQWQWDDVVFHFLRPPPDMPARASDNAKGCVLLIKGANGSLLIPADIGQPEEAELLASMPAGLQADVLVVPHHGSNGSSSSAFIAAVKPALAIATNGYLNPFRHPRPEVLARYADAGVPVWRSDQDGAVILDFDAKGRRAQRWRKLHSRYWSAEPATPAASAPETR
jgi:competence protein ComEC